jgi:hypothetical protein
MLERERIRWLQSHGLTTWVFVAIPDEEMGWKVAPRQKTRLTSILAPTLTESCESLAWPSLAKAAWWRPESIPELPIGSSGFSGVGVACGGTGGWIPMKSDSKIRSKRGGGAPRPRKETGPHKDQDHGYKPRTSSLHTLSNDQDHRHRATNLRHGTETQSRWFGADGVRRHLSPSPVCLSLAFSIRLSSTHRISPPVHH